VYAGRAGEAEPLLRGAVRKLETTLPAGHWEIDVHRSVLGECLHRLGRLDEAKSLLTVAHAALSEKRAGTGAARRVAHRLAALE
jgi:hypothetical protein